MQYATQASARMRLEINSSCSTQPFLFLLSYALTNSAQSSQSLKNKLHRTSSWVKVFSRFPYFQELIWKAAQIYCKAVKTSHVKQDLNKLWGYI